MSFNTFALLTVRCRSCRYHVSSVPPATLPAPATTAMNGLAVAEVQLSPQDAIDRLPPLLRPGAGCADHAPGIRSAFESRFPGIPLTGCWPHVAWHFSHGKLLDKKHKRFETIQLQLAELHTCHTVGMWDVLVAVVGQEWGRRDTKLNALWDSVLVAPRNNWHLGVTQVPGSTPSQQAQESWHNAGVMQRVKRELNASTEHVLNQTLPRLIALDGVPRHLAPCTIPCNFLLISCPKLPDPSDTRAIASL